MKPQKGTLKVCSRGHKFYKSSDRPVCPVCWPGYYRKQAKNDFPETLGAPAVRALRNAKITKLAQLKKCTEKEIAELHGMGPKGIGELKKAMREHGMEFKKGAKK